ncbi:hypothetical protein M9979_02620 [Sphingomonas sp. RP10(2022)]|uniref:Uncharacterized protein n=1 Tax=Sphingomonas liriopis TaxID=2949094 RepID=A0A9X2HW06_9SPHN|nr:hypothetical protein [Sphingomonas liriopis]MCP3733775.1 hypothetical protein [Sphingomonas liriopis]
MMRAIRRFLADLFGAYADGARVVAGLPLLFGAIIAWEFAQHVVEYRIGFFDSKEIAKAVSLDPSRMALGWVKMILVYVGGFFAIRFLVNGSARGVMTPRWGTMVRYLPYIAYALTIFALIFYARALVPAERVTAFRGTVGLIQIAVEPLLMLWIVSAATDGPVRTPWHSARRIGSGYVRALALFFIGRMPIGAAHQFLGTWAIGRATPLLWPMLVLDAVVVGLLIAIIPAIYVRVAARRDRQDAAPVTARADAPYPR